MIKPADLARLRTAAPDYSETERLKAWLTHLRHSRQPFFLTGQELEPVFRWKLGTQDGRVRDKLGHNTELLYQVVTGAAFEIPELADAEYETELRVSILTVLRGVGLGMASAILVLTEPQRYCVIDFRGWRALFDEERTTFSIPDYNRYLAEVRGLAQVLNWPVQEVDLAMWEYDRRKHVAELAELGSGLTIDLF